MTNWTDLIANIGTWKQGDQRAVHKPLLTLLVLSRAYRQEENRFDYESIEAPLKQALLEFGPPRKSHHPELPFWYLKNDGFWEIDDEQTFSLKPGRHPTAVMFRTTHGTAHVPAMLWQQLINDEGLVLDLARSLLITFWPPTYHEGILAYFGLPDGPIEMVVDLSKRTRRDPNFRNQIMTAYQFKCAFCGFDGRLKHTPFGLEAAHIQFFTQNGPDRVENGLALCSLHHKAFDYGVMGVTSDFKIQVSPAANGNDAVARMIMDLENKPLLVPRKADQYPGQQFIDWHECNVFAKGS